MPIERLCEWVGVLVNVCQVKIFQMKIVMLIQAFGLILIPRIVNKDRLFEFQSILFHCYYKNTIFEIHDDGAQGTKSEI